MPDICCLDVARRTSHVARRTSHRATRAVPQGRAAAHAVHVTAGRALLGFSSCAVGGNSGDLRRDPRQRVDREKPVHRHNTAVRFCRERCGPRSMQGRRRNSPPPTWRHRMPVFVTERRTPSRPGSARNDDEWPEDHPTQSPNLSKIPRANVTGVFLVKQFASTECEYPRGTTRATRVGGLQGAVAEAAR